MAFYFESQKKQKLDELDELARKDLAAEALGNLALMREVFAQKGLTKAQLKALEEIIQGIRNIYESRGLTPPSENDPVVMEILRDMGKEAETEIDETEKPSNPQVERKNWSIEVDSGLFLFDGRIIKMHSQSKVWKLLCAFCQNPNQFITVSDLAMIVNQNSRAIHPMVKVLRKNYGLPVVTSDRKGNGYAIILGEQLPDIKTNEGPLPKVVIEKPTKGTLKITIDERSARIEGKSIALINAMFEKKNRAISIEELCQITNTDKGGVQQLIYALRRKLEKNPHNPNIFLVDLGSYIARVGEIEKKEKPEKRLTITASAQKLTQTKLEAIEEDTSSPISFNEQEITRLCKRVIDSEQWLQTKGVDIISECSSRYNGVVSSSQSFQISGKELPKLDRDLKDKLLKIAISPERLDKNSQGSTIVKEIIAPLKNLGRAAQEEYLDRLLFDKKNMVFVHEIGGDAPGALRRIK